MQRFAYCSYFELESIDIHVLSWGEFLPRLSPPSPPKELPLMLEAAWFAYILT